MRTAQLEYFVAVAETLSFTRASELCHVAQPAISQQIQSLEKELGFSLFVRSTKGVELTPPDASTTRTSQACLPPCGAPTNMPQPSPTGRPAPWISAVPETVIASLEHGYAMREVHGYEATLEIGWVHLVDNENPALATFLNFLNHQEL